METRHCRNCAETLPSDCFRKGFDICVWCCFSDMATRAAARWDDKRKKSAKRPLEISKTDFITWYCAQKDCCSYCGLTFAELKTLRLQRAWGYVVSWDIDRLDPKIAYKPGNLALSCFICNMVKGESLTPDETRAIGAAVRGVWDTRLAAKRASSS